MTLAHRRMAILEQAVEERFIRAPGPGGQHVNKVATAVELRFDAAQCAALGPAVLARLRRLAGRRMSQAGVIVITASRFRSQERNRADARARLAALIEEASATPKRRRPTKPTKGGKERRLVAKKRQAQRKRERRIDAG
ncbi:MAG: alternative ribosome rescue aminoacyl-tRNA hydrolase ArfB [Pseudomonadota bacterium]